MVQHRPEGPGHVEVEAKIGQLKGKTSGQRVQLPVLVETSERLRISDLPVIDTCAPRQFLHQTRIHGFESNMTAIQHKHYNTLLNGLKTTPPQPGFPISPLEYTHLRLVDNFYQTENPREKEKIRVTRDEKTGTVHACMRKIRLGSLDIYSPKRAVDWRISVNMEVPVNPPVGTPTHTRRKDRLSYSHEEFIIDLTQVTSTSGPNSKPEILHELELELARPEYLLSTASKRGDLNVSEPERSAFDELIRAFVNNARILVRNAGDGWQ
ncbi:hypothetical protein NLI96_g1442 [Meripilus lineatus]|uniref:mRNA-capping enzyme subunit beta n=1 Tax=Meripilus lineatus TaxID=2056292 RepID=A0AAD5VAJ2_9APHY|nr:hypothetical protein NLI96_g1442 [Physisporinus lineatus]